jgi:decaprenylphospho-beta-D-ribofuranose 2-oxidase
MKLTSWGRFPVVEANCCSFETAGEASAYLAGAPGPGIAHAMGRSYGDSALSENVFLTRRLKNILAFDEREGVVTCEAGVSLAELIDVFLPRGWFPTTTPGTKFVSVGGAIASDVHGKNHHVSGCFGDCVESFELLLPDGRVVTCSPAENVPLFRATCGGMGLTGLILTARVRLRRVQSCRIDQHVVKAPNLRAIFDLFDEYARCTYSVAWIDCISRGDSLGRSIMMAGEHADDGVLRQPAPRKLNVPMDFPSFALNGLTVRAFNTLYYYKQMKRKIVNKVSTDAFFYPLDAIHNWNRIYGKGGFTQYQCVVPKAAGYEAMVSIVDRIAESGLGSFLAVLKLFGKGNANLLSFPMEGYTLALDFKITRRLFPLLDELDRIVLEAGGRLYLTKDVRMPLETFERGYPNADAFRAIRKQYRMDEAFQSLQSRRLEL